MANGLTLSQYPWLGIAVSMVSFLALLAALTRYCRAARPDPELARKLLHVGAGLITLSFPVLFSDVWPAALLSGWTAALLLMVKLVPAWQREAGRVLGGVGRGSVGEFCFPLAVASVFWLSRGEAALLFVIPILVLTLADAAAALVGRRCAAAPCHHGRKTLEGSAAFLVTAFLCTGIPLLVSGDWTSTASLQVSATLAVALTVVEAHVHRGLDNLAVPIGGYFMLRELLRLDAGEARLCFVVAVAAAVLLEAALLVWRQMALRDRLCWKRNRRDYSFSNS